MRFGLHTSSSVRGMLMPNALVMSARNYRRAEAVTLSHRRTTLLTANNVIVEVGVTYYALKKAHPEWHNHHGAARGGDVAQIDNILRFPAEPLAQIFGHLFFGGGIISANEQIVIARNA